MKPATAREALTAIYAFHPIGENLGTSGQPTEQQFREIREAGFKAVINLALPTSNNAIPNEGSIVAGLGMSYVHIPVDFQAPTSRDFDAFSHVMKAFSDQPVFVHCAVNKRVSAFIFLYRVLKQGVSFEVANADLHAIWSPEGVWAQFIQTQLKAGEQTH